MKKLLLLSLLALATFAADVKGTWKGQVNRPDGTKETDVVLQLTQSGDAVSGKVGTHSDDAVPIENAKLDGNKLTFTVPANQSVFTVSLDLDGDNLKGSVVRARDGQTSPPMPMELKRSAE